MVFYKGLPEYTKNTKRLSNAALNIREAKPEKIIIPIIFHIKCPIENNNIEGVSDTDLNDFIKSLNYNYSGKVKFPENVNAGEHLNDYNDYTNLKSPVSIVFKRFRNSFM